MKRIEKALILLSLCLALAGCGVQMENENVSEQIVEQTESVQQSVYLKDTEKVTVTTESEEEIIEEEIATTSQIAEQSEENVSAIQTVNLCEIPAYTGKAYTIVNDNIPFFSDSEMSTTSYESYSELDSLGRCGVCVASIGQDIMPTEERGEIGSVKPTGWHTVKYAGIIDGNYLYNRCHLIGFQLAGENANTKNLITGTRNLNVEGMLPFENMVADYVKETGNHVMYRVTPMFEGDNLVANGVLMEAKSVEDSGKGILFNVFCYNVQPGITIDYATGESVEDGSIIVNDENTPAPETKQEEVAEPQESENGGSYAVNSNNGKIHIVGACSATGNGDGAMKHPVYFDTYEEAEEYSEQIAPSQEKRKCGNCW